jgi:hypothetical protein
VVGCGLAEEPSLLSRLQVDLGVLLCHERVLQHLEPEGGLLVQETCLFGLHTGWLRLEACEYLADNDVVSVVASVFRHLHLHPAFEVRQVLGVTDGALGVGFE